MKLVFKRSSGTCLQKMLKLFLGTALANARTFSLIQVRQEELKDDVVSSSLEDVNPTEYLPPIPTLDDLSLLDDMSFSLEGLGNSTSLAHRRRRPVESKTHDDLSEFMNMESDDEFEEVKRPRRRKIEDMISSEEEDSDDDF